MSIDLEKATNGHDADSPTGPEILEGDPVVWTYVVTNTGGTPLTGVSVTDDKLGVISCPKSSLDPGEMMTCEARGTAEVGQYENHGWAKGTFEGVVVEDHDPSHYIGKRPPEPCGPCDGKVTTLTLRYLGGTGADIEVKGKKDGNTIFDDFVPANGTFTVTGFDKKGTLGTEILMFVNGSLDVKIHTSCSQPIGPGMTFGSFLVEAGASRNGGPLCPADPLRTTVTASWLAPTSSR